MNLNNLAISIAKALLNIPANEQLPSGKMVVSGAGMFSRLMCRDEAVSLSLPLMHRLSCDGCWFLDLPQIDVYCDRLVDSTSRYNNPCILLITMADLAEKLLAYRKGFLSRKKIFDDCPHVNPNEMTNPNVAGWSVSEISLRACFTSEIVSRGDAAVSQKIAELVKVFASEVSQAFERAGITLKSRLQR